LQLEDPTVDEFCPAEHHVQMEAPEKLQNLPIEQFVQMDEFVTIHTKGNIERSCELPNTTALT
jgi:hypothetical protein